MTSDSSSHLPPFKEKGMPDFHRAHGSPVHPRAGRTVTSWKPRIHPLLCRDFTPHIPSASSSLHKCPTGPSQPKWAHQLVHHPTHRNSDLLQAPGKCPVFVLFSSPVCEAGEPSGFGGNELTVMSWSKIAGRCG